jgi:hypothetical protein
MSAYPTDKRRYKSPSGGDYVTCAQYVAEAVCTRMAEKENIGSQSYKFWNTPKWKKVFQYQVVLAHRLLRKYPEAAVVRAVHSPECKRMYSLRYPLLEKVIQKYQAIIDKENESTKTIDFKENAAIRKNRTHGKKTKLQKLRELDGQKEDN